MPEDILALTEARLTLSGNAGPVEILKGIVAGDTVVVAGQSRLRDGVPVEVLPPFQGGTAN